MFDVHGKGNFDDKEKHVNVIGNKQWLEIDPKKLQDIDKKEVSNIYNILTKEKKYVWKNIR